VTGKRSILHHGVRHEPIEQHESELPCVEDGIVLIAPKLTQQARVLGRVPCCVGIRTLEHEELLLFEVMACDSLQVNEDLANTRPRGLATHLVNAMDQRKKLLVLHVNFQQTRFEILGPFHDTSAAPLDASRQQQLAEDSVKNYENSRNLLAGELLSHARENFRPDALNESSKFGMLPWRQPRP
jgi:hypothetical protein